MNRRLPNPMKLLLLTAALLLPAVALAGAFDELKTQAPGEPGSSAPEASGPEIRLPQVVLADNTPVVAVPGSSVQADMLTQLRRGESVTELGSVPGYKYVEVNRRDFNPATGGWEKTKGYVPIGSISDKLPNDPTRNTSMDIASQFNDLPVSACRQAFIAKEKTFVGVPFVYGGTSHSGVDCSGLVQAAILEAGCLREPPPRTAAGLQQSAKPISDVKDMQPGDLIFVGAPAHHVFTFLGPNDSGNGYQVIEAQQTGTVVSIHDWSPRGETFGAFLQ